VRREEVVEKKPVSAVAKAADDDENTQADDHLDVAGVVSSVAASGGTAATTTAAATAVHRDDAAAAADDDDDDNSNVDLVFDKCVFALLGTKDRSTIQHKVETYGGLVSLKVNSRVTHIVILNGAPRDYPELKTVDIATCAVVNPAFVLDSIDATVLKDSNTEAYSLVADLKKSVTSTSSSSTAAASSKLKSTSSPAKASSSSAVVKRKDPPTDERHASGHSTIPKSKVVSNNKRHN
jgi:hypothetical protein